MPKIANFAHTPPLI